MREHVTHVTDRRQLTFTTLDDILADVEALDKAESRTAAGNWTPAQIVEHVATFIEFSLDGFPFRVPLLFRLIGPLFRTMAINKPMKPGIIPPKQIQAFEPDASVQWDDAVAKMNSSVQRVRSGEKMQIPSPLLGKMSHEDWTRFHCRHAEMHFSFVEGH